MAVWIALGAAFISLMSVALALYAASVKKKKKNGD